MNYSSQSLLTYLFYLNIIFSGDYRKDELLECARYDNGWINQFINKCIIMIWNVFPSNLSLIRLVTVVAAYVHTEHGPTHFEHTSSSHSQCCCQRMQFDRSNPDMPGGPNKTALHVLITWWVTMLLLAFLWLLFMMMMSWPGRSGQEEKLMALLTPLNVNCHASDGRKVRSPAFMII